MTATNRPVKMDIVNIKRREYYRKYRSNPEKVEHNKELARARYKKDPERYRKYGLKWKEDHPNYSKEYYQEYYRNGKHQDGNKTRTNEMAKAHSTTQYHKLPIAKFCEVCPEDDIRIATMRHHPDYNYPTIFISTCRACHTAHHRLEKKQEAIN